MVMNKTGQAGTDHGQHIQCKAIDIIGMVYISAVV